MFPEVQDGVLVLVLSTTQNKLSLLFIKWWKETRTDSHLRRWNQRMTFISAALTDYKNTLLFNLTVKKQISSSFQRSAVADMKPDWDHKLAHFLISFHAGRARRSRLLLDVAGRDSRSTIYIIYTVRCVKWQWWRMWSSCSVGWWLHQAASLSLCTQSRSLHHFNMSTRNTKLQLITNTRGKVTMTTGGRNVYEFLQRLYNIYWSSASVFRHTLKSSAALNCQRNTKCQKVVGALL